MDLVPSSMYPDHTQLRNVPGMPWIRVFHFDRTSGLLEVMDLVPCSMYYPDHTQHHNVPGMPGIRGRCLSWCLCLCALSYWLGAQGCGWAPRHHHHLRDWMWHDGSRIARRTLSLISLTLRESGSQSAIWFQYDRLVPMATNISKKVWDDVLTFFCRRKNVWHRHLEAMKEMLLCIRTVDSVVCRMCILPGGVRFLLKIRAKWITQSPYFSSTVAVNLHALLKNHSLIKMLASSIREMRRRCPLVVTAFNALSAILLLTPPHHQRWKSDTRTV